MKKRKLLCLLAAATMVLTACSGEVPSGSPGEAEPTGGSNVEVEPTWPDFEGPSTQVYIQQIVADGVALFYEPGMGEYEYTKAAFDYIIGLAYYTRPVGLDVWRWRTTADTTPSYVEMRGSFLLNFGSGTCEDYAAALMLLLEHQGIETRYITGLTYSTKGDLVFHSWMQAKVDDVWYHLDVELEDGISQGTVRYRYFMRGDATMSGSHYWGQRLINLGTLNEEQNQIIAEEFMGESCPRDYPTPSPTQVAVNARPDTTALKEELKAELSEYEAVYGPLEYIELDVLPPVFVKYYHQVGRWPEEGEYTRAEFVRYYAHERTVIHPEDDDGYSEYAERRRQEGTSEPAGPAGTLTQGS